MFMSINIMPSMCPLDMQTIVNMARTRATLKFQQILKLSFIDNLGN